jgi:DNA-directed RNA polymerase specialized sigma24 family protein
VLQWSRSDTRADGDPMCSWRRGRAAVRACIIKKESPEYRELVSAAMKQLSPRHRAVIGRAFYLRWTTDQLAADLQITEAIVKSELHYALHALLHTLRQMTE